MGVFDKLFSNDAARDAYNDVINQIQNGALEKRSSAPQPLIEGVVRARIYASAANKLENNTTLNMTPIEEGTLCVVEALEILEINNFESIRVGKSLGLYDLELTSLKEAVHLAGESSNIAANQARIYGYAEAQDKLKKAAAWFLIAEMEF